MQKTLPLAGIKAVIFDMDGTMINNMAFHKKAWYEFCKRHGLNIDEKTFKEKISGKANRQIFSLLFGKELSTDEVADYTEEKERVYREIYSPEIKPVKGLLDILKQLSQKGIKLAVATTAPRKNREFVLQKLGLQNTFSVILGDEDVTKGKPDPEIFINTAKQLGVNEGDCLVFEDSPPGVEAGKKAGMVVVGVLTTHSNEELSRSDLTINDFTELRFD